MRKILFTIGFFIFVQINILAQTTYTTRASFDAAATGTVEVLNFDNLSDGTTIPSGNSLNVGTNIGNATFTYSIPSVVLRVRDRFPTTSGSFYLRSKC